MKICTKCKIDKEDKEFQTYWHSTQQKFRIRKECTLCHNTQHNERRRLKRLESKLIQVSIRQEIIQPVVQESQPDLSTDKNYKQCRTCQQFKIKTEYYQYKELKKTYLDCKPCINKKELERTRRDRLKELEENGGSQYRKQNPGEWVDDYQKEATYDILKAIGWKLNEENGIWWKDGIKTKDGVFINIKTFQTLSKKYEYAPRIRIKPNKLKMFDDVIRLRLQGNSYEMIGYKIGISDTTVFKWVKEYEANKGG